jgi:polar amino acid transport system substrate-binding protein
MTSWQSRVIFAHLEEPPFCFRTGGRSAGCDVELARTVLQAIGVPKFESVVVDFSDLIPGLLAGRWTMTTGLFITPARQGLVTFSRPIWALPDGLLVKAGNPKHLAGYASLAADPTATLAVGKDQVQHERARAGGVPAARIREYASQDEAANAVAAGAVDAYASVAMAHRGYLQHHRNTSLAVIEAGDPAAADPPVGAFAFAKSNAGLARAVDNALASYLGSPDHRALMATYGFTATEIDRVAAGASLT